MCDLAYTDMLIGAHWKEHHSIERTFFLNMFYGGEERERECQQQNYILQCNYTFEFSVNIHCYFISYFYKTV